MITIQSGVEEVHRDLTRCAVSLQQSLERSTKGTRECLEDAYQTLEAWRYASADVKKATSAGLRGLESVVSRAERKLRGGY